MNETAGGGGSAHADGDRRHRRTESELSELSSVSAATKFNSLGSSSPRGDWSASAAGDGRLRWGDKGFSSQESSDPLYWPTADQKRLVAAADRQQQPQKQPQKQKGAVSGSKRKGKQSMPGLLQQQTILEEDDS